MGESIQALLDRIPGGYTTGIYQEKKYGITKSIHNAGRSIKIFAKELGGENRISMNYYRTENGEVLKPCEMPEAKVIDFLREVRTRSGVG